jgi:hypothetical protein
MGLFSSKRVQRVDVGTRYQSADTALLTWEVSSVFNGIDGMPYAQIFCVQDPSRRKTVAQGALESGGQYLRQPAP